MDKQRLKRLEEFIAPLRVKPGKRVKLARDFDPAYKAEINKKKEGVALVTQGVQDLSGA